jgi:hypothetical protein
MCLTVGGMFRRAVQRHPPVQENRYKLTCSSAEKVPGTVCT